jgi:ABC-type branched-subunit amino acid transport system ATPase component
MKSLCCCFDGSNLAGLSLNLDDESIKKCKHKKSLNRGIFYLPQGEKIVKERGIT